MGRLACRSGQTESAVKAVPIAQFITIGGVVQGVGFRPFVFSLARKYGLNGWVRNTSAGVEIHAEGTPALIRAFVEGLRQEPPPLARIDSLSLYESAFEAHSTFEIRESAPMPGAFQPISPDVAVCPECLRELRDPNNRRYRYPFINCTHCGPRFTIIQDVPYDRPATTMSAFPMCTPCAHEYHDPTDRRFHAQPTACPECGPMVWLERGETRIEGDAAIRSVVMCLQQGEIAAIKGLGGFHLACDALNERAVAELRARKRRVAKPFALMLPDLETIRRFCHCSEAEARLLTSRAAPIVLLERRADTSDPIAPSAAPRQNTLGVMLPYTPLHVLLFEAATETEGLKALIMTSGNHSEEPILTENEAAREHLTGLADVFLLHNRDIHIRTDDSVVRVFEGCDLPLRRSRGYAPYPVHLPDDMPSVLAVGGELKNTFCLTRERYAFMSHHIGDLSNYQTLRSFESGIAHFERLFRIQPTLIACDLHPDYLATRYAQKRADLEGLPAVGVAHHHAHIGACMVENGLKGDTPVIGVSFDGTGYGPDGTIWGGEFLIADYEGFERAAYLKPVALPGGDAAARKPARIALSHLINAGIPLDPSLPPAAALSETERTIIQRQIERGLNAPLTSSMGRLFDAVSALLGLCQISTFEGEAAMALEAVIDPAESGAYCWDVVEAEDSLILDPAPAIHSLIADQRQGMNTGRIAARFHTGLAHLLRTVCLHLRRDTGLNQVALSGGVFQNVTLLKKTLPLLRAEGFEVLSHRLVPPNDGGLALGQAVIAYHQWRRGKINHEVSG